MDRQQTTDLFGRPPTEPALGGNAESGQVLPRRLDPCCCAVETVGVVDESQEESGLADVEFLQRRKIGVVGAITWHGYMEVVGATSRRLHSRVRHEHTGRQIG